MLIWGNCKKYNMEGSVSFYKITQEIYKMADSLEKSSKKLIDKFFKPKTESAAKPPKTNTTSYNNQNSDHKEELK